MNKTHLWPPTNWLTSGAGILLAVLIGLWAILHGEEYWLGWGISGWFVGLSVGVLAQLPVPEKEERYISALAMIRGANKGVLVAAGLALIALGVNDLLLARPPLWPTLTHLLTTLMAVMGWFALAGLWQGLSIALGRSWRDPGRLKVLGQAILGCVMLACLGGMVFDPTLRPEILTFFALGGGVVGIFIGSLLPAG